MRLGRAVVVMALMAMSSASMWTPRALASMSRTWIAPSGETGNDFFGESVGSAGDVNGDGYADLIVGATGNDAGGVDAGRAYVYFGGPGADVLPDLTLTGEAAGDSFGSSVGTAGDVNGDGYADVIVGAPLNDAAGVNAGRAYVYFGGPRMDAVPDLTLTGAAPGDELGCSVGTAGDLNGDGYTDVIVGAVFNDAGGVDAGRAYVYFGGPGMDQISDLMFTGAAAGDNLGSAVGAAGDVNGDGNADVIVGATYNLTDAGRAYIYFGGAGVDALADLTLVGTGAGDCFGSSVGTAGDVNGDGYADVIVGALYNDLGLKGLTDAGRAYVYFGGPSMDATPDLTFDGQTAGTHLGASVHTAGDVDGDGYDDVIVGAPRDTTGGASAGQAYIYLGGPNADAVPDFTLTGSFIDILGQSVGTAGDMNGDGRAEVIIGAPNAPSTRTGRCYVVSIFPYQVLSPNGGEQWVAGQPGMVRWLGRNLVDIAISRDAGLTYTTLASNVGGADENTLWVTAPSDPTTYARIRVATSGQSADRSNSDAGDATFRIVAPVTPPAAAVRLQRTFNGTASNDYLGWSVATAGDVNGDGYADVIVGAPDNDAGGLDAGRAYVFFGGPGADTQPDLTLTGTVGEYFGYSVAGAGDVNGDGYADLIVGAPHNGTGGIQAGKTYVFFGGPSPDAGADLTLSGVAIGDDFGWSVATAGDVNADGYADVIVGAVGNDAGGLDAGRAFVYFGSPSMNGTADLTFTGAASGDGLGYSVGTAGDVNGDGYADVIVGAPYNDAIATNAGRAYVYYGGPGVDTTPDLTFTGAAAGDYFGSAVGSVGDMNGDGCADMVVGAPFNDGGGMDAGRAYVYFGGPAADGVADLILTGAVSNDQLGTCVGAAGDVNGDGYADVIVTTPSAVGQSGAPPGLVNIYYGSPAPDATTDVTLKSSAGYFGYAAATAGDVNGDGLADVIIGAPLNFTDTPGAGSAFVYDFNRYQLLAPVGGETWNVGATRTISWLGAEKANLWLSTDAGKSYDLLASNVGGEASNAYPLRVPHSPGKFGMIKVAPADVSVRGFDRSDSMFTIQTSVSLLALLAAPAPDRLGASVITWSTDPGPADLAGYKLEKGSEIGGWRTLVALTKETTYTDGSAALGASYRLSAVNGLGEELWLGETSVRPVRPLAAWPLPYRGGNLNVSFATYGGLGGGLGQTEVSVYDVQGRLVRRVAQGAYAAGYQTAVWDGTDSRGARVAAGVYLLRVQSEAGASRTLKLAVLR